jgi:hypothetical protein
MRSGYDLPTAVTFLMAGLGLGAFLTLLVAPHSKGRLGKLEWDGALDESTLEI